MDHKDGNGDGKGPRRAAIKRQRRVIRGRRRLKNEDVSGADTAIKNSAAVAVSTRL